MQAGNPFQTTQGNQLSCREQERSTWKIPWMEEPGRLQSMGLLSLFSFAAAAAKSLQSCPTLCDPRDGSPPGSPIPGILQARTLEWVAISNSRGSSRPRDQTHMNTEVPGTSLSEPLLPS